MTDTTFSNIKTKTEGSIIGSALTLKGETQVLKKASGIIDTERYQTSPSSHLYSGRPRTYVFTRAQSPLSWIDYEMDYFDEWIDLNSNFYIQAYQLVKPDNMLYRMMQFRELRDELAGATLKKRKTNLELLDEVNALLMKCDPLERHYQIIALREVYAIPRSPRIIRVPEMSWAEFKEELKKRYPTFTPYFENKSYSLVTVPVTR